MHRWTRSIATLVANAGHVESAEVTLRRLQHQALKRGTVENGLLLGGFARQTLSSMSARDIMEFESIISEADVDLFRWLCIERAPPEKYASSALFGRLKQYCLEFSPAP